jgi:hypothetical protein
MKRRFLRASLFSALGLTLLCVVLVGISALSNRSLPARSQITDRLSEVEKARLAEAIHLRQALGETVWPGWGLFDIPIIVYNEEYAFLVGYPDPPDGWVRMPQNEPRGGPWEAVPDDAFEGQGYYRQRLTDPAITPENFTVLVGERWAATMETKEYMEVHFYAEFREQFPPFLQPIFPYRLAWGLLMGETETYIGGLEHESFHAFQGSLVPERLAEAETANRSESLYLWDDPSLGAAWQQELDLLIQPSGQSRTSRPLSWCANSWRGRAPGTGRAEPGVVDYERQREWLRAGRTPSCPSAGWPAQRRTTPSAGAERRPRLQRLHHP